MLYFRLGLQAQYSYVFLKKKNHNVTLFIIYILLKIYYVSKYNIYFLLKVYYITQIEEKFAKKKRSQIEV